MTSKIKVALLIDAENMPPGSIAFFLDHCRSLGHPAITRCYGKAESLQGWASAIAEHHLMPMMTPSGGKKDNATDFALTIDAVSMLHRNIFDCAVIASSDTDFIQLAMHVREHGKGIHGIGDARATPAMRKAFDHFVVMPTISAAESVEAHPQKTAPVMAASPQPSNPPFRKQILTTYDKLAAVGRITLGEFGQKLRQQHPEVALGKGKLKKTLLTLGLQVNEQHEIHRP